jgi:hypothetical protein
MRIGEPIESPILLPLILAIPFADCGVTLTPGFSPLPGRTEIGIPVVVPGAFRIAAQHP